MSLSRSSVFFYFVFGFRNSCFSTTKRFLSPSLPYWGTGMEMENGNEEEFLVQKIGVGGQVDDVFNFVFAVSKIVECLMEKGFKEWVFYIMFFPSRKNDDVKIYVNLLMDPSRREIGIVRACVEKHGTPDMLARIPIDQGIYL